MSTTINSYTTSSYLNYATSGSGTTTGGSSLAQELSTLEKEKTAQNSATGSTISLSEEAQAYLAQTQASDANLSKGDLAARARLWFTEQYKKLGISSPMLDGKLALDMTGQSRASLAVVAENSDKIFTDEESAAAKQALDARFNDVVRPYTVIARHSGDYAQLYEAALNYMDQAGEAERGSKAWKDQRQAIADGLAKAKKTYGKAPEINNANDKVQALLNAPASAGNRADVSSSARTKLDDQINKARDKGQDLVFRNGVKGQQADLSVFDNQALAAMSMNTKAEFTTDEAYAAKTELNKRTRLAILETLQENSSSSGLALINQYSKMSTEEKSVLGINDSVMQRLVDNYRSMQSAQQTLNEALSFNSYL